MTERDALYRAILANPEDDTPRFVYADWLEENGRAEEAEFIRVECRLETLAPDDPEFTDLLARQEELRLWLTAHVAGPEVKLSGGLHVAAGAEWWKATHRGFPRFLEIEGLFDPSPRAMRSLAAALAKAFARLPTRWLVLRYISCAQLAELLRHPELALLDRLTVHLSASEDPQDEAACRLIAGSAHLRNLRGLVLAFPVDDAGASELASSPHLSELRALALDQCMPCTAAAIRALDASEWFRRLNQLDLRGLDDAAFEELCRLEPLPNLHTLELDESSFPISSWRAFARSTTLPRLTSFRNGTDMSAGQTGALADAAGFRLSVLNLGMCAIGNDGAEALAGAPWLDSLRWLGMSFNRSRERLRGHRGSRRLSTEVLTFVHAPESAGCGRWHEPALCRLTTLRLQASMDRIAGLTPLVYEFSRRSTRRTCRLDLSNLPLGWGATHRAEKFANLSDPSRTPPTDTAICCLLADASRPHRTRRVAERIRPALHH